MSHRDQDLTELAREQAARRALSPQAGDTTEAPTLSFAELRGRIPIRAPWWSRLSRLRIPLGLGLTAAAAALVAVVFLRPPPDHTGIKGAAIGCGDVRLHLGQDGGPLDAWVVRAGAPLTARAELPVPCHATLVHALLDTKAVTVLSTAERAEGSVALAGHDDHPPLVLGDRGAHLLVLLATPDQPQPSPSALVELLAGLGEGQPCQLDGLGCSVDVVKLEVR